MKRQVRLGVFETNSSSTHSLTIVTEEEFNQWRNGELLFDNWYDTFISVVSIKSLTNEEKEDVKKSYEIKKQKYWKSWDELTEEEHEELYQEAINDKSKDHYRYRTYNDYMYHGDLETYAERYTSPSGDKIVAFGHYGYDG